MPEERYAPERCADRFQEIAAIRFVIGSVHCVRVKMRKMRKISDSGRLRASIFYFDG
jgi:hypothetical protein